MVDAFIISRRETQSLTKRAFLLFNVNSQVTQVINTAVVALYW